MKRITLSVFWVLAVTLCAVSPCPAGFGTGDSAVGTLDATMPEVEIQFPLQFDLFRGGSEIPLAWTMDDVYAAWVEARIRGCGEVIDEYITPVTERNMVWNWIVPDILCNNAVLEVQGIDQFGNSTRVTSCLFTIIHTWTAVPDTPTPHDPRLDAPHPNPFNPVTEIHFFLPAPGDYSLTIYDLQGRLVRHLRQGRQPAGIQRVTWNGADATGRLVAGGVYLVQLAGHHDGERILQTRKVVMLP
ncbi:MAG: FlgD immunoglobulin-like domain containing protein [bacterium]